MTKMSHILFEINVNKKEKKEGVNEYDDKNKKKRKW